MESLKQLKHLVKTVLQELQMMMMIMLEMMIVMKDIHTTSTSANVLIIPQTVLSQFVVLVKM